MRGTTFFGVLVVCLTLSQPLSAEDNCSVLWFNILGNTTIYPAYDSVVNTCDKDLRKNLNKLISDNDHHSYLNARKELFAEVFHEKDNTVRCVYTDTAIKTTKIPSDDVMNTEHIWPQSLGAKGIAKSDLHHLAPSLPKVNSLRGNLPFCEVEKESRISTQLCLKNTCKHGYSKKGTQCFEPPAHFKGDIARATFYFSVRYSKQIDPDQEAFLRKWHEADPVSQEEKDRNDIIFLYQHNRNPFIDHPEFVSLISDL